MTDMGSVFLGRNKWSGQMFLVIKKNEYGADLLSLYNGKMYTNASWRHVESVYNVIARLRDE